MDELEKHVEEMESRITYLATKHVEPPIYGPIPYEPRPIEDFEIKMTGEEENSILEQLRKIVTTGKE